MMPEGDEWRATASYPPMLYPTHAIGGDLGALPAHAVSVTAIDKTNVKTYGFGLYTPTGAIGQTSWSPFALSTGWYYLDKNPFGTKYNFDQPKLVSTWDWLQEMYKSGFIAPPKLVTSLGEQPVLDQNVVAMMIQGTWQAAQRTPKADKAQSFQWVQLPSGPVGHPVSITNSIGPAINPATKYPAQAVKWAEFTVSATCADIVAASGVAIPTIEEAKTKALANLKAQGVDTQYWQELLDNPSYLRQIPISASASQINDLGNTAFDQTLAAGVGEPQQVLTKLNSDVNALLKNK